MKINLFLSYKERTKHNVIIFSIIKLKMGQVEKPRFDHGRTWDWCYRNFLKTMNYLNMALYKNERFPFNPLMVFKTFSLFLSKFSLWLAKDSVTEGLQERVKFGKCCSWLISCEIIMSGLMKPTEKFVPIYELVKNKKMFQRAVLVFP